MGGKLVKVRVCSWLSTEELPDAALGPFVARD